MTTNYIPTKTYTVGFFSQSTVKLISPNIKCNVNFHTLGPNQGQGGIYRIDNTGTTFVFDLPKTVNLDPIVTTKQDHFAALSYLTLPSPLKQFALATYRSDGVIDYRSDAYNYSYSKRDYLHLNVRHDGDVVVNYGDRNTSCSNKFLVLDGKTGEYRAQYDISLYSAFDPYTNGNNGCDLSNTIYRETYFTNGNRLVLVNHNMNVYYQVYNAESPPSNITDVLKLNLKSYNSTSILRTYPHELATILLSDGDKIGIIWLEGPPYTSQYQVITSQGQTMLPAGGAFLYDHNNNNGFSYVGLPNNNIAFFSATKNFGTIGAIFRHTGNKIGDEFTLSSATILPNIKGDPIYISNNYIHVPYGQSSNLVSALFDTGLVINGVSSGNFSIPLSSCIPTQPITVNYPATKVTPAPELLNSLVDNTFVNNNGCNLTYVSVFGIQSVSLDGNNVSSPVYFQNPSNKIAILNDNNIAVGQVFNINQCWTNPNQFMVSFYDSSLTNYANTTYFNTGNCTAINLSIKAAANNLVASYNTANSPNILQYTVFNSRSGLEEGTYSGTVYSHMPNFFEEKYFPNGNRIIFGTDNNNYFFGQVFDNGIPPQRLTEIFTINNPSGSWFTSAFNYHYTYPLNNGHLSVIWMGYDQFSKKLGFYYQIISPEGRLILPYETKVPFSSYLTDNYRIKILPIFADSLLYITALQSPGYGVIIDGEGKQQDSMFTVNTYALNSPHMPINIGNDYIMYYSGNQPGTTNFIFDLSWPVNNQSSGNPLPTQLPSCFASSPSITATATDTPTHTRTPTHTATPTHTHTSTPTPTHTHTPTHTITPTHTHTPSKTPSSSESATPSETPHHHCSYHPHHHHCHHPSESPHHHCSHHPHHTPRPYPSHHPHHTPYPTHHHHYDNETDLDWCPHEEETENIEAIDNASTGPSISASVIGGIVAGIIAAGAVAICAFGYLYNHRNMMTKTPIHPAPFGDSAIATVTNPILLTAAATLAEKAVQITTAGETGDDA